MKLSELASGYHVPVACDACGRMMEAVDRYMSDWPPIPRDNPESFVEFYRHNSGGDPDDRLAQCEGCGADLELDEVHPVPSLPA